MSGDHNANQKPKAEPAPGYCKHCKRYTVEEPLQAKQEPVAWSVFDKRTKKHWYTHESRYTAQHYANEYSHREPDGTPHNVVVPLYTAPQPATTLDGKLMMGLAVIRELTGTQQTDIEATIEAVRKALAPQPRRRLTDEQIEDAVREADLDWHQGWTLDDDVPNRFTTFARAIEAAIWSKT